MSEQRVVVFDKFIGYNVGGAQRSLLRLVKALPQFPRLLGCDVRHSFGASQFKTDLSVDRIPIIELPRFPYIEYWLNRRRVMRFVASQDADVLLTQSFWAPMAVLAFPHTSFLFVRSESGVGNIPLHYRGFFKKIAKLAYLALQFPFLLLFLSDTRRAMKKATVIANSHFIAKEIKRKFDTESTVLYPLVDTKDFSEEPVSWEKNGPILSVGSEYMKGPDIVSSLAKVMPDRTFCIVGREYREKKVVDNVTYHPWVSDPTPLYRGASVILVPSICGEAFSRVALEASALGIPVVASDRGGIGEIVDHEFLVHDIWNIALWKEKVRRALGSSDAYRMGLKEKAKTFDAQQQIDAFLLFYNSIV